jgi:hypothetical protein
MSTIADLPGTYPDDWWYLRSPTPRLGGDQGAWTASVTFICKVDLMVDFVTTVGGTVESVPTGFGAIPRVVPLRHPLYPGLFAVRVEAEPFGTPSTTETGLMDQYSHARVTVEFASRAYGTEFGAGGGMTDVPYLTVQARSGGKFVQIPGWERYHWQSDGRPLDSGSRSDDSEAIPAEFVATTSYVLSMFQCQDLNDVALDYLLNGVNESEFLGRPEGTLRLVGWEGDLSVTIGGVVQYLRRVMLEYRELPWNQAYRPDTGEPDTPLDGDGLTIFEERDFHLMFN